MKFRKLLYWLTHRFCPDMVWNRDMSLEIERLQRRIDELEGK